MTSENIVMGLVPCVVFWFTLAALRVPADRTESHE